MANFVRERVQKHGPIFKTHILGRPTVVMVGAEANRFVLSKGIEHFSWGEGWPFGGRFLGVVHWGS